MKVAKEILDALGYGDVSKIARQCGVTTETVRRTYSGKQNRPDVVEATLALVEQKKMAQAELNNRIENLKKKLLKNEFFADLAITDPDAFETELLHVAHAG